MICPVLQNQPHQTDSSFDSSPWVHSVTKPNWFHLPTCSGKPNTEALEFCSRKGFYQAAEQGHRSWAQVCLLSQRLGQVLWSEGSEASSYWVLQWVVLGSVVWLDPAMAYARVQSDRILDPTILCPLLNSVPAPQPNHRGYAHVAHLVYLGMLRLCDLQLGGLWKLKNNSKLSHIKVEPDWFSYNRPSQQLPLKAPWLSPVSTPNPPSSLFPPFFTSVTF